MAAIRGLIANELLWLDGRRVESFERDDNSRGDVKGDNATRSGERVYNATCSLLSSVTAYRSHPRRSAESPHT